jgi:hypothetical protein
VRGLSAGGDDLTIKDREDFVKKNIYSSEMSKSLRGIL